MWYESLITDQKVNKIIAFFEKRPRLCIVVAGLLNVSAKILSLFNILPVKKIKPAPIKAPHGAGLRDMLDLKEKTSAYRQLAHQVQGPYGFIEYLEGDSLLFTGLYGAGGLPVEIEAARDSDGFWQRRPVDTLGELSSKSSISRDMLMGLMWYIWRNKRLDLAQSLYEHGKSNNFIMGTGDPFRTYFTPSCQALLANIISKLGGKNLIEKRMPQAWSLELRGYQDHLQILTILLMSELNGFITPKMLKCLESSAKRNPKNPLAVYAYNKFSSGNYELAVKCLLDADLWPSDRLPESRDRSGRWLPEREFGQDWLPDLTDARTHSGGDLVFVSSMIFRDLYEKSGTFFGSSKKLP